MQHPQGAARPPSRGETADSPRGEGPARWALHGGLFALTFLSVLLTQVQRQPTETFFGMLAGVWAEPARLDAAWPFAVVLMAILAAHEAGHYLVARFFRIAQSLPFFLPAPLFFMFGTLGAVIVTRQTIPHRRALLRMAAAGPWAGLAVALPAAIWGLAHSTPLDAAVHSGVAKMMGRSLLFGLLEDTFSPSGSEVLLHPVAQAAWVGLFFTGLNLIPAAQLDGGHISFALLPNAYRRLGRLVVAVLGCVGLAGWLGNDGAHMWLLWALVLSLVGLTHPQVDAPEVPLTRSDRRLGWASLALFVLTWVPTPWQEVFIEVTAPQAPGMAAPDSPGTAEDDVGREEFSL